MSGRESITSASTAAMTTALESARSVILAHLLPCESVTMFPLSPSPCAARRPPARPVPFRSRGTGSPGYRFARRMRGGSFLDRPGHVGPSRHRRRRVPRGHQQAAPGAPAERAEQREDAVRGQAVRVDDRAGQREPASGTSTSRTVTVPGGSPRAAAASTRTNRSQPLSSSFRPGGRRGCRSRGPPRRPAPDVRPAARPPRRRRRRRAGTRCLHPLPASSPGHVASSHGSTSSVANRGSARALSADLRPGRRPATRPGTGDHPRRTAPPGLRRSCPIRNISWASLRRVPRPAAGLRLPRPTCLPPMVTVSVSGDTEGIRLRIPPGNRRIGLPLGWPWRARWCRAAGPWPTRPSTRPGR